MWEGCEMVEEEGNEGVGVEWNVGEGGWVD